MNNLENFLEVDALGQWPCGFRKREEPFIRLYLESKRHRLTKLGLNTSMIEAKIFFLVMFYEETKKYT